MFLIQKYKGYLPLKVRAVPEGSVIPVKNILFSVESTDSKVPWIATWFEVSLHSIKNIEFAFVTVLIEVFSLACFQIGCSFAAAC